MHRHTGWNVCLAGWRSLRQQSPRRTVGVYRRYMLPPSNVINLYGTHKNGKRTTISVKQLNTLRTEIYFGDQSMCTYCNDHQINCTIYSAYVMYCILPVCIYMEWYGFFCTIEVKIKENSVNVAIHFGQFTKLQFLFAYDLILNLFAWIYWYKVLCYSHYKI